MLPDSILKNPSAYRYVNNMLNIAYLTGFVRNPEKDKGFLLQQNNNFAQAIPIRTQPGINLPKDKTPVTVFCHLSGEVDENGDQNLVIRAIDIQKPSLRAMPALTTWVRGAKQSSGNADDFRPFASGDQGGSRGELNEELAESVETETKAEFSDTERVLRDILEATRGRLDTRLGDNANVVMLAGFVDSLAYIEGNEYQKGGYGAILLRQARSPEQNIPVRLYNPRARAIMKHAAPGIPISVAGQIRMKIIPNEDGTIKSRSLHVRVADLYRADRERDIKEIPDWWSSIRDRVVKERAERQANAVRKPVAPAGAEDVVADL